MQYEAYVTSKYNCKVSHLRSDDGGEYISKDFKEFCVFKDILIYYTTVYTPQLNRVAERMNRTVRKSSLYNTTFWC